MVRRQSPRWISCLLEFDPTITVMLSSDCIIADIELGPATNKEDLAGAYQIALSNLNQ